MYVYEEALDDGGNLTKEYATKLSKQLWSKSRHTPTKEDVSALADDLLKAAPDGNARLFYNSQVFNTVERRGVDGWYAFPWKDSTQGAVYWIEHRVTLLT